MNGLLAVKLWRDLRASWSRFTLMILAIAVSVLVFGAVLTTWSMADRETRSEYLATEPASATFILARPLSTADMATLVAQTRSRQDIIEATGRTQFPSEVDVNGSPRELEMTLFVVAPDDPLRMAAFELADTDWPPADDQLLVRRDSLALLDVAVDDTVTVTTPDGRRLTLHVTDTVYDPSLAPSPQHQQGHGYVSAAAIAPPGQPLFDQLKVQIADPDSGTPSDDRDAIVRAAEDIGHWLQQEQGLGVREIQVPEPYAHPHQGQTDALLLSVLAGAAASLLLSTILVATMLNTMFTQQIPQIGILKAIGAPTVAIRRLYLAMTLLVAAAATVIATPPAILFGRGGSAWIMGFLGIEPANLTAPGWAYAVIVAAGLGLPCLIALVPIVRASRTTVREAIDHHGTTAREDASNRAVARLSRIRRLDRSVLMALRNTVRRPARFALSVGLLASAGSVFVAGLSLGSGVQAIDDEKIAQRTWDVDVQLARPTAMADVDRALQQVTGITRVEGWRRVQVGVAAPDQIPVTRTYPDQGHGGVTLVAPPADSTMLSEPKLLEGRWLDPAEQGAVVINQIVRGDTIPGARAGDTIQLHVSGRPTTWRIVGIVQEREGGGGGIYTTAEGFAAAMSTPPQVNQLRIATAQHDETTRTSVAEAVQQALTHADVPVATAASVSKSDDVSEGHLGPIIAIVLVVAIAMGVVGIIGLASTMSANVLDRVRELAVMHAIGATPRAVRRIVIFEGAFLAVASILVAVLPALALTWLLGAGLGNLFMQAPLPYRISGLAVGLWIGIALLGAALATDAAATRASRVTVREALAYL